MKKYTATLTAEERQDLQALIAAGKAAAQRLAHARLLLKADAAPDGPAWTDEPIAEAVEVSAATVARVRQRFVEHALEAALGRKSQDRPSRQRKRDGRAEARLVAPACSPPPEGRTDWTMRRLADQPVELGVVDPVSDETVRRTPKGTSRSRGRRSNGAYHRSPTPSSWRRWGASWMSTTAPSTPSGRRSASTRRVSN